jgi:hypothetical protein
MGTYQRVLKEWIDYKDEWVKEREKAVASGNKYLECVCNQYLLICIQQIINIGGLDKGKSHDHDIDIEISERAGDDSFARSADGRL